ncbi:MAG: MBL fold metallo-hydrolase [Synergistaceae bacterium]|jgi:glyoxylase-like metal-dependent hydrolase (beta-lactamase superfamily II)|nr:MBL fold metallo-hydrolase [Synergistaceae bacterium]
MTDVDERRKSSDRRTGDRRETDRRSNFRLSAEWEGPERRVAERRRSERRTVERRSAALPEGLYLLDLPQPRPGFRYLISAWFFVDSLGRRVVVDPGPPSTIPLLLDQLSAITNGVDLVLLTHIHLDHSGGIGQFCERYGSAKVLVHPKARRYLVNPEKLWKASLETLGDIAEMYGAPLPLNPGSLLDRDEIPGVTVLETPGHAPHHLSFLVPFRNEKLFFVGEAAGIFLPLASSPTLPYMHPTTPPKFDGAAAQASLRKIESVLQGDELLCYSHWGAARRPRSRIALAKGQLDDWLSLVSEMKDQPEDVITEHLLSRDSLLKGYSQLSEELREREAFFIEHSVKGFLEYLRRASPPK